ncbi:sugar phosphate isomerase/epimerase [Granulicella sp. S156]|uniref:sugar phosphate isomerase/epimerase family protein n=1 Tax=Granulicella sp. S156 TaxID=1747224 RepID=UPI00131EB795|nr:sugar phosphate isomerase/epimerase [Granulicella sp. S156]
MCTRLARTQPARLPLLQVPIGLQLYSVGDDLQKDVPGTLRQIRALGYERVETAGFAGLTAKAFRTQLDQARLVCPSTHLPVGNHELGPLFEDAHVVGARYVVSSALFSKSGDQTLDDYRTMADRLNDLGRKAKAVGLQYAYHNHNFEFRKLDGDRIGYDVLLKHTDPELVAFELDCGWIVAAGFNPIEYFRHYPGRYRMLHVKDFVATTGPSTSLAKDERPQGVELGRGHIHYKPILLAAAEAGIHDYYVEQEPPFLDMPALAAIKVDYQYLRTL